MEAVMRTTTIPLVLLLGAGIAPAAAQTTILNEPLQLTPAQQTIVYRTIVRERVAPAPKAAKAGKKDARRSFAKAGPTIRTTTHERIVTEPAPQQRVAVPVRERAVTAPREVIVDDALIPADQSRVVYRSIMQQPQSNVVVTQPVAPAPIITQPVTPAPVITQRPLVVTEPDPIIRTAPVVRERVIAAPPATTGMAPVLTTQRLVVGERVPSSVQLYAMPPATVAAVPGMARFHYAIEDDRVFLVDPTDSVVVAELYR
jgi:hypothetical protein